MQKDIDPIRCPQSSIQLRFSYKLLVALALAILSIGASGGARIFAAGSSQAVQEGPVAVVAASYQGMDAAMNAGTIVHNIQAARIRPDHLLSSTQARVSSSASGAFLYSYDLYRVQTFRTWVASHTLDYSAITIWSTFQAASVSIYGGQATVKGVEIQHIDATIHDNRKVHQFSPAKEAAQQWIKKAGLFIDFGQTNHATASLDHTVTLSLASNGWVIETDNYWDPLAQALAPDHRARTISGSTSVVHEKIHPMTFTYNRQSAINYAESWAYGRNSKYNSYANADCANFVSQAIYDESGGNLPGDNAWYSINRSDSFDFVNVGGLYSHTINNFAAARYSSYNYGSAAYDDDWFEYPGDLIFYDWGNVFGFGNADGVLDHVAISVVQDANGYTYEDAHTTDLKHYYWDLGGGTQTGYFFLILKDNG